jgi:Dioxygenase
MDENTHAAQADGITRRPALMAFGGVAATALGTGAWKVLGAADADAAGGPAGVPSGLVSCVLTPEQSEGPYYLDGDKVRRTITEGRSGVALTLRLTVVDASTCRPLSGAAVDVWHCDASGTYSGVEQQNTVGKTFMRGIQRTNARGMATFHTVYPAGTGAEPCTSTSRCTSAERWSTPASSTSPTGSPTPSTGARPTAAVQIATPATPATACTERGQAVPDGAEEERRRLRCRPHDGSDPLVDRDRGKIRTRRGVLYAWGSNEIVGAVCGTASTSLSPLNRWPAGRIRRLERVSGARENVAHSDVGRAGRDSRRRGAPGRRARAAARDDLAGRTGRPRATRCARRRRRSRPAGRRRLVRRSRPMLRPRGRGGTGRRDGFRSRWARARGGSSPLARIRASRRAGHRTAWSPSPGAGPSTVTTVSG